MNSIITNANIQQNSEITNAILKNSMIGSNTKYVGSARDLSLGDFSTVNE